MARRQLSYRNEGSTTLGSARTRIAGQGLVSALVAVVAFLCYHATLLPGLDFGDSASFRRQHVAMAGEAGFASAASTIAGVIKAEGRTNLNALPRLAWDGRQRSLRALRVMLSGIMLQRP